MRTVSCASVVACLIASRPAEADYSKAWAAAKDNLPASTQIVVAIDVATLYKSSLYGKALDAFRNIDRDLAEIHDVFKTACGWDPFSVIDGVVLAAEPKNEVGIAYVQLSIDRTKASACIESALKSMKKGKPITVKQEGAYTVASKGTGSRDSAYFPWVGNNVVAISIRPDKKDVVDAWYGQKGFAKSTAASAAGKLDPKAVLAGVFVPDKIDSWFPISKAYGNWTVAAGKVTGVVVMTGESADKARKLGDEIKEEIARDMKRDRTPPSIKKIMGTISVAVSGSELTIKGSASEKDLGDAFGEAFMKKKSKDLDVAEAPTSTDCGKQAADAMLKMDEFSKRMCQCKVTDRACADKVNEDMTKWGTEMAKKAPAMGNCKPEPAFAKQAADIMTRYTECMTKIMMNAPPPPTPAKK